MHSRGIALVTTKVNIPLLRRELVARQRLYRLLDDGLRFNLILLSTPAGFGKTTLVAEWIRHRNLHAGWISLDERDNDLNRFLSYVVRSINSLLPENPEQQAEILRLLQAQTYEAVISVLINRLERERVLNSGREMILVLDDYHLIDEQAVHESVAYLLDHIPVHFHLVISSRADPPLHLARLRARAQLMELRSADLRFTQQEVQVFLNHIMGFDLKPNELDALSERTEGWIAGLQMAAISIRGRDDPTDFIQAFTGSNRFILDYLLEEVLHRQPDTIQKFLVHTSILKRFCGPLCDYVLQDLFPEPLQKAQSVLEYLDKANLFVFSLDDRREWYRYHRLFADLLLKRFGLTSPELVPELNRRASEWSELNGEIEDAIDYALNANDYERAANLIDRVAEWFMNRGEFVTLRHWLQNLPDEMICRRPNLCVFYAWMLLMNNSPLHQVEKWLELVPTCKENQAILTAPLRAYIAILQGLFPQASDYARQALQGLPEGEGFLRSMVTIVSATCEMSEGDPQAGFQAFEQTARSSIQAGNILASVIALTSLGENHRKLGQLHQAETVFNEALERAVDSKGKRMPIAGRALCGLGDILREWNRLDEAEQYLEEGIGLLEDWGAMVNYSGYISLAMLKQEQGDISEAMEIIFKVRQIAYQTLITKIDDWVVELMLARLWIASGDLNLAQLWAERRGLLQEPDPSSLKDSEVFAYAHLRKYEMIALARLRLAQGQYDQALQILTKLMPEAIKMSRLGLRIEILVLQARTLALLGKMSDALSVLEKALSLAEPSGYTRIFLDEGDSVYRMLSMVQRRTLSSGYAARLLAAFEGQAVPVSDKVQKDVYRPVPVQIDSLSAREMEVLNLLKSRLTVPEIADMLFVAESTMRSHIKSIYSKLDVHRRIEAIQKAEELGLLG